MGDYYQLNPAIRSDVAEKKGMNVSLFEKLCKQHPTYCSILKMQYRMNADIHQIANNAIYKGIMRIGSQEIAEQMIDFPKTVDSGQSWLELTKHRSVSMINTDRITSSLTL